MNIKIWVYPQYSATYDRDINAVKIDTQIGTCLSKIGMSDLLNIF